MLPLFFSFYFTAIRETCTKITKYSWKLKNTIVSISLLWIFISLDTNFNKMTFIFLLKFTLLYFSYKFCSSSQKKSNFFLLADFCGIEGFWQKNCWSRWLHTAAWEFCSLPNFGTIFYIPVRGKFKFNIFFQFFIRKIYVTFLYFSFLFVLKKIN